jgi:hypothetical protein
MATIFILNSWFMVANQMLIMVGINSDYYQD